MEQEQAEQKLIWFDVTATPDGGATLTIRYIDRTEEAPRTIHGNILEVSPHVADMLRSALVREIPQLPFEQQSDAEFRELMLGRMVQMEADLFG
ncbi:hypothetical protein [Streptomyces sp. NPDC057280]|uniref:hypothetical protein n=1 Tax=Streptomyces sp. NPDC057280 TaxID=3346081 RepID=UPI0036265F47